jgi:acetoacetate decarboxylase
MSVKMLAAAAALALVCVFATSAAAGNKIETKVTIKGQEGDYFGFVKSPNEEKCANGREVRVYKAKHDTPDPGSDKLIGTDTAQPNGDGVMWSIGNSGFKKGHFYAQVKKTKKCQGDLSKVIDR